MYAKCCGVYIIKNNVNEYVYVGSSSEIKYRWRCHKKLLKEGTHHCRLLQKAFDEGIEFEYVVKELCERVDLFRREQYWMDQFEFKYNTAPKAGSGDGIEWSEESKLKAPPRLRTLWKERKHTPEAKELVRQAKLGIPRSEETKQKISEKLIGKSNTSGFLQDLWDDPVRKEQISKNFSIAQLKRQERIRAGEIKGISDEKRKMLSEKAKLQWEERKRLGKTYL